MRPACNWQHQTYHDNGDSIRGPLLAPIVLVSRPIGPFRLFGTNRSLFKIGPIGPFSKSVTFRDQSVHFIWSHDLISSDFWLNCAGLCLLLLSIVKPFLICLLERSLKFGNTFRVKTTPLLSLFVKCLGIIWTVKRGKSMTARHGQLHLSRITWKWNLAVIRFDA